MCLVVVVEGYCGSGYVGGFVVRLSSRGFRAGSLLAGGWGWVMVFCISGFTFLRCLVGVCGV